MCLVMLLDESLREVGATVYGHRPLPVSAILTGNRIRMEGVTERPTPTIRQAGQSGLPGIATHESGDGKSIHSDSSNISATRDRCYLVSSTMCRRSDRHRSRPLGGVGYFNYHTG